MPKRTDIHTVMIIGAGPIVIGQACEFDYSGTQGVKALKEEGYKVVLVNSNPATIMTDPELADATYLEPVTPEVCKKIIRREKPDALLPTLGGQTALNTAVALAKDGFLKAEGVELIGASLEAIRKSEDRELFKQAMTRIGLHVPKSGLAHSVPEAMKVVRSIGYPAIIRPAFTLGGSGGSIAYNREQVERQVEWGLSQSPVRQLLIEESVLGWKEYELEVMRDLNDNVVIVCSIENFDPMGVHTGDSITVAPAQTLTDKEYQRMRNAAIAIIREIGVATGGSNIQFAVNPKNGEMVVIEMNPRVSRSSALASKATGFPIAKFATKLAVGYTLDEIRNDITKVTPASFEPTIDYVVTKVPRFAFEKFPQTEDILTTQMKSVGEAMAIGRTFKESLQKAIRSLEIDSYGFEEKVLRGKTARDRKGDLRSRLKIPRSDRLWWVAQAFREKMSIGEIHKESRIDPWFLRQIEQIVEMEKSLRQLFHSKSNSPSASSVALRASGNSAQFALGLPAQVSLLAPLKLRGGEGELLSRAKQWGFSDRRLAQLTGIKEDSVRVLREKSGIIPVFKRVDTCGAEFTAHTPYLYSTYEKENEAAPTGKRKVVILGGGPNRIGQGIEFDTCCVHASFALAEEGIETIMVNCNPETVSTDYDTSDRLYFEPLTMEDVTRILQEEKPEGVIVQFGGQTPLKLAVPLEKWGAKILGTSPDSIDVAEDRKRFAELVNRLKLRQPRNGLATSPEEAIRIAQIIGYPVLVRPSYVLGGRAMEIVYDETSLVHYMKTAVMASPDRPILIDQYLEGAIEVDVDAISDGERVVVGGIMEHIEHAGIHSGDSACCLPPHSLSKEILLDIGRQTERLAMALKVCGLMNVQYAVKEGKVYILEVNPRASRTIPFVSKAIGVPLAKLAAKVMIGRKLTDLGFVQPVIPAHFSVKEAVFPFSKFSGVDTLLGPEMKSTGEVMGMDDHFGMAFAKAEIAAGTYLPTEGKAFISVRDADKKAMIPIARDLAGMGFAIVATSGTAAHLSGARIRTEEIRKVREGSPHIVDLMEKGQVALVINTHEGKQTAMESFSIRRTALIRNIPYFTTVAAAQAATAGIRALIESPMEVKSLQEYAGSSNPKTGEQENRKQRTETG